MKKDSLEWWFENKPDETYRLYFSDGKGFLVRAVYQVAESIYGYKDQWSCCVVNGINLPPEVAKFHRPNSGLDFRTIDLAKVVLDKTGDVIWEQLGSTDT
jgi:hypothetical protein